MPNPKDFAQMLADHFKDIAPKATLLPQEKLDVLREKYNYDIIQDDKNLTSFYIKARGESTYDKIDINLTEYITNYTRNESYESYTLRRIHCAIEERDTRMRGESLEIQERDNKNRRGDFRDTQREGEIADRDTRARRADYLSQELQQKSDTIRKRVGRFIQIDLHKTKLTHNELESFKEQCFKQTELKNEKALLIQKALKAYNITPPIQKSQIQSKLDSKPYLSEYQKQEALKAYGTPNLNNHHTLHNTETHSTQELDSTPTPSQNTSTKTQAHKPIKRKR